MKNNDEGSVFLEMVASEYFLGLDPVTTFRLLESSLPEVSDIVRLNDSFDSALLEHAPAEQKTELLLRLIGEAGTAKATKLGNLPKKLVNDFCIHRAKDLAQIQSEEYVPELGALRCLVTDAG